MASRNPIIIGLTGGIASGKSLCLKYFKAQGAATLSSDNIVADLLANNKQVAKQIAKFAPAAVKTNKIDKSTLGKLAFNNPQIKTKLEAVLHPLVMEQQQKFVSKNSLRNVIVVEVPLLFEAGLQSLYDYIIVTDASLNFRLSRLRARKKYDAKTIKNLVASQMPQKQKLEQADFTIKCGLSKRLVFNQIRNIINLCKEK